MYASEAKLSKAFQKHLKKGSGPLRSSALAHEFYFVEGKTDVIALNQCGDLLAFEMKLAKWKKALEQAYRNTSFAHYSYVVLPLVTAETARKRAREFARRGVGLCSVDGDGMRVEIIARRCDPLLPWLTRSAVAHIEGRA